MKYLITFGLTLLSFQSIFGQNNNSTFGQTFEQTSSLTPGRLVVHLSNTNTTGNIQLIGYVRYITNNWIILSTSANSNDYVIVLLQNFTVDQSILNKRVMVNGSVSKTAYTQEVENKINQAQLTNPYTQNGFVMSATGVKIFE